MFDIIKKRIFIFGENMERKESAHGLQLIHYGAIALKGRFSQLFMGTFAMVTPLALIVLVPAILAMLLGQGYIFSIGVILFAIFVGPIQMGYIKFFNMALNGEQPKISVIYSQLKFNVKTLRCIYISMLLLLMYIVGGILWIVPAGFAISFFSMVLFFLEKYDYDRLSVAMKECARHMIGNRLALFSYKIAFYFVYFALFIIGGLLMALVYTLLAESVIISWLIAVCSSIIFIFLYSMITVYFHSCNQIFFEDTLMYEERRQNKKLQEKKLREEKKKALEEKLSSAEETKKEEVKEAKESDGKETKTSSKASSTAVKDKEDKKIAQRKSSNKPSTKKSTTSKKTTTTKNVKQKN